MSANALEAVDHRGGLDAFLLKAKDDELAPKMRELKRDRQARERPTTPHQRELRQQLALNGEKNYRPTWRQNRFAVHIAMHRDAFHVVDQARSATIAERHRPAPGLMAASGMRRMRMPTPRAAKIARAAVNPRRQDGAVADFEIIAAF